MNQIGDMSVSIPLSKTKLVLILLGSIAFVVIAVWIWSISDIQTKRSPLFLQAVSLLGSLFFGMCGIYAARKIFDKKPGLILDSEGLVDNSSGVSAGRIPWSEITGIRVSKLAKQKFLSIHVEEPKAYLGKGNFFVRKLNATNLKLYGTPIHISSNSLKINFENLVELVSEYFEKFSQKSQSQID